MTKQPAPIDLWDTTPLEDGELPDARSASEIAAVHIRRGIPRTRAADPGRSDVAVDGARPSSGAPSYWFDDEEPEGDRRSDTPDSDHEPDLEEILEAQHYAFEAE